MLVVADSSPLNFLVRLGYADQLPKLFQAVAIPPQVAAELSRPETPKAVRDFVARPPRWLIIRAPANLEHIPRIDAGEAAAISLALELKADLLLIDETAGRKAALQRSVPITGTVGVLRRAAENGLLDLSKAFERLKREPDFWIEDRILDEELQAFLKQQAPQSKPDHG